MAFLIRTGSKLQGQSGFFVKNKFPVLKNLYFRSLHIKHPYKSREFTY